MERFIWRDCGEMNSLVRIASDRYIISTERSRITAYISIYMGSPSHSKKCNPWNDYFLCMCCVSAGQLQWLLLSSRLRGDTNNIHKRWTNKGKKYSYRTRRFLTDVEGHTFVGVFALGSPWWLVKNEITNLCNPEHQRPCIFQICVASAVGFGDLKRSPSNAMLSQCCLGPRL